MLGTVLKNFFSKRKPEENEIAMDHSPPTVKHYNSLDEILDSRFNDEPDQHSNRNSKGLDIEMKLNFGNWAQYHSLLMPKVGIEHTGKRIRIGKAETIKWINCERSEYMLLNSLTPEVQKLVSAYPTTRQKWRKPHSHFSGKNKAREQNAIKKLTSMSRSEETLTSYIANVEQLISECEIAHGQDSIKFEELGKYMLLAGLDPSFNAFKTVLENSYVDELTFRQLGEKLVNEDQNRLINEDVGASLEEAKCIHNRVESTCYKCHPNLHPHAKMVCSDCKVKGHKSKWYRGCKANKSKQLEKTLEKTETGAMLLESEDIYDPNEDYDTMNYLFQLTDGGHGDKNYVAFTFGDQNHCDHILDSDASKNCNL
jgi:hypothetical protein